MIIKVSHVLMQTFEQKKIEKTPSEEHNDLPGALLYPDRLSKKPHLPSVNLFKLFRFLIPVLVFLVDDIVAAMILNVTITFLRGSSRTAAIFSSSAPCSITGEDLSASNLRASSFVQLVTSSDSST